MHLIRTFSHLPRLFTSFKQTVSTQDEYAAVLCCALCGLQSMTVLSSSLVDHSYRQVKRNWLLMILC